MRDEADLAILFPALRSLAREAGDLIMGFYDGGVAVRNKADQSPVTDADLVSDRLILARLGALTPDIPVITEETYDGTSATPVGKPFWLVDPLDGTREFIAHSGEFTVNIGLIGPDALPVLGVMYAPFFRQCYWGQPRRGAWMEDEAGERPITTRRPPEEGLTVVSSRYHGNRARVDAFLADYKVARHHQRGSTYKFCEVARGDVDLYPHFGQTSEWDTAAGHAVLLGAGGNITSGEGGPFTYGKPGLRNGPYIVKGKEF